MNRAGGSSAGNTIGPAAWIFSSIVLAPPAEYLLRPLWGGAAAAALTWGAVAAGTLCAAAYALYSGAGCSGGAPAAWLAGLAVATIAAAGAGPDWFAAFPVLFQLQLAATAFLLTSSLSGEARRRLGGLLPAGLAAGGVMACVYALTHFSPGMGAQIAEQLAELPPEIGDAVRARLNQGRAFSYFVYPNAFAGYLLLAFPAALGRALNRSGINGGGLLWWAFTVVLGLGLLASGSMGAAICLAASMGLTAAFSARRNAPAALFALIAAIALLGAILAVRGPGALAENARAKLRHWRAAVVSASGPREIILGQGPGRYGEAVGLGMDESLRARLAHNWPVQTYVETGLAGLAVLTGLLCALLKAVFRRRSDSGGTDVWGLKAGWLAWLLHSFADIDYALPALAFPWWCIGGYLAALPASKRKLQPLIAGWSAWLEKNEIVAAASMLSVAILVVPYFVGVQAALVYGAFLAAASVWLIFRSFSISGRSPIQWRVDWPWLALLGAGLVWVAPGLVPAAAYRVALESAGLFAVMLMTRRICRRTDFGGERILRTAVSTSVSIYAVWGIAQYLILREPARAGFPSPNLFASFMLAGFSLGLGSVWRSTGPVRWAAGVSVALGGASMAAAGASGPLLAAAAVAAGILPAAAGIKKRSVVALTAVSVAALSGIWLAFASMDAVSVSQRGTMWREAARLMKAEPFGSGPGSYSAAAETVREPSVTSAGIGRYSLRAQFAHNEPAQFAVEWGIPAFGVLALGILTLFVRRRDGVMDAWQLPAAGLLLLSLVDFPLRVPACKLVFVMAAGALSAGEIGRRTKRGPGFRTASPRAVSVLAAGVALLTGISLMRPAAARRALEMAAAEPQKVVTWAARAQSAVPLAAEPHFLKAQAEWGFLQSTGFADPNSLWRIDQELGLAHLLSGRDAEIGVAIGYFLFSTGDVPDARAAFLDAAASAPTRPHPWLWTARTYMAERDWASALGAIGEARKREPFLLEALVDMGKLEEMRGNKVAARRHYRTALVLRARLKQRKEMNPYEAALCRLDEGYVKGRLLDLGPGR